MDQQHNPNAREGLVVDAVTKWTKDLVDLGSRNTLLYYRDLAVGTISLEQAEPLALTSLLAGGRTVRLSSLFATSLHADMRKRARTVHKKVRELQEERGINAGYLADGMVSWTDQRDHPGKTPPAAPIVLRQIELKPRSATEDDFELTLSDAAEVNPVLLQFLRDQFRVTLDDGELSGLLEMETAYDPTAVIQRISKSCAEVPGFQVSRRTVIGTFTYAKLPMVNDLQNGEALLAGHDVIAALAGDGEAQRSLRAGSSLAAVDISAPNHTPPADEFLVLDADSSQNHAINAVVSGRSLVIKGPPGTGKSQTISNLISSLVARGQRVLFVAEKRAAIDAVLGRLQGADLDQWVMDLHSGLGNRRRVAQSLAETLDRAGRTPVPRLGELHRDLTTARDRLLAHDMAMHQPREPWRLSVFEVQTRLLGLDDQGLRSRLGGDALRGATKDRIASCRQAIEEYADLDGLTVTASDSPWFGAPISDATQAQAAMEAVTRLREHTLPEASVSLHAMVSEVGLPMPRTVAQWGRVFTFLDGAAATLSLLQPAVFDRPLADLVAATATRKWRKEHDVTLSWGQRRRLKKVAKALRVGAASRAELHERLVAALDLQLRWKQISTDGRAPRTPSHLAQGHGAYQELSNELRAVGAQIRTTTALEELRSEELPRTLSRLAEDRATLQKLPRRNQLERQLNQAGFGALLEECRSRGIAASQAADALEAMWLHSILEAIGLADAHFGGFQGITLSRAVDAFTKADTDHIRTTPQRVQRGCAERLYAELDAHPEQATLIRAEANKKTRHKPMRELLAAGADVLLALKPCWAMSPLVVSQVLPMKQLFDVVIFDEASQIPPADAIASIARGARVVVAGDERQLPPTSFFAAVSSEEEEFEAFDIGGESMVSLTSGYESILDALATIVPFRGLEWHYRSQDERLIAFSNAHIYDSSLTTFPGAQTSDVLRHELVTACHPVGEGESVTAEVTRVVDLVLEHAQQRPEESLGVITMGIKHAARIQDAVRLRLSERPELLEFFDEGRPERFFVKNLERVQGDERDAIILSIGYGKGVHGTMVYRFGPLNADGGERRLNVAVSRAKRRMTLVSSFGSADLDPNKLNKRGAQLLGAFLGFMESGGVVLGSTAQIPPPLNPFEIDVRDRLSAAGIPLTAQFGVSSYRIDFAASHPRQPGRMVLAIEADGASYHSSHTARDRDRLRQEHLERLGWRFHRIWSTDWFRDPDTQVRAARAAYDAAVRSAEAKGTPIKQANSSPAATVRADHIAAFATKSSGSTHLRAARRPDVLPGQPIATYAPGELVRLVRWVESDGLLRTEDELLRAVMTELGFSKKGSRIAAAISQAIRRARSK